MFKFQVLTHPFNEVILECSFDELMQNIGSKELMDVGARKVVCKGLWSVIVNVITVYKNNVRVHTTNSPMIPYSSQRTPKSTESTSASVCSRDRETPPSSRVEGNARHL